MAGPKLGFLQTPASCSVCLDVVSDGRERSIAKLMCGHEFHLDCIGSAFNAKGSMQCPNCRHTENGQWLYANGSRQRDDTLPEDTINEEDYDMLAELSEFLYPQDLMQFGHLQWCPFQSSYAELSLSLGDADSSPAAHADLVVDVLVDESVESSDPCPFIEVQGSTVISSQGHLQAQESHVHPSRVPEQQHLPYRSHWSERSSSRIGSRWSHYTSHSNRDIQSAYYRNARREFSSQPPSSRASRPYSDNQSEARTSNWDFISEAFRRDGPAFQQHRETPSFRQYLSEPEVQRWAPPPLSGLYGLHSTHGAEVSGETGFRTSDTHFSNPIQSPLQYFQSFMPDQGTRSGSSFHNPR